MNTSIKLHVQGLFLPLRTTFKQASSVRNQGESIWCEARRGNVSGYGEGCPRAYVTGEKVGSGLAWLAEKLPLLQSCHSLDELKVWMSENRTELDEHPAAFCAVETALLDLFSKEKNESVEHLLGIDGPAGVYTYTAILGDSDEEKFMTLTQRYIAGGFTDFKVKVNGELEKDQKKLDLLTQACQKQGISNFRIRLDANNLWAGNTDAAIEHLSKLNHPLLGIEEPLAPKNYPALSTICKTLDLPIILDESLCNLSDLKMIDDATGNFIANLKVSRLGGVIRSLEMVNELKKRGHQIIVGAHVGETSILTRAGMCVANAAGRNLIAQEGGFGLILLENEPAKPSLMFGEKGQIDLTKPYQIKTPDKIIEVPIEFWNSGWGLQCKSPI